MSEKLENKAAWQMEAHAQQLSVSTGPDQSQPAENEVVIKVATVAINPSEWKMQQYAYLPLEYPHVFGSDVAGEVVLVGENVRRFKPGDRVMGHCLGLLYGGAKHGGFQTYTTCRESVTATIPDELTFAEAVVLPLALSTAMTGLFEQLQLKLPSIQESTPHGTVLIWGGSSSVGSTAIQLAVAAGYKVITTASPHNFAYVKSLGASEAIDHSADDAEAQIIRAFSKDTVAGVFDCIGEENTTKTCAAILSHFGGGVVPTVLWPPTGLPENVKAILVYATNPGLVPGHVGAQIWEEYVPLALSKGRLQARPEAKVLTGGLDAIQGAMDLHRKGVSAQKIVVEIQ